MTFPKHAPKAVIILGLTSLILSGCDNTDDGSVSSYKTTNIPFLSVALTNDLPLERRNELVTLSAQKIRAHAPDFNFKAFKVMLGTQEVPSQVGDNDNDGIADQILFTTDFKASEHQNITITYAPMGEWTTNYPKRTQAELSIRVGGDRVNGIFDGGKFQNITAQVHPKGHTPGDKQFRYEGPGWESDKVAYRLYFDHRNTIDIFGKKVPDMVLQNVGHEDYSYHKEADWGLDILKVNDSLGMGSPGMWLDGKAHRISTADDMAVTIAENGNIRSQVRVDHTGWKIAHGSHDVKSTLSIHAGSRMTHNLIYITNDPKNLVAGIVKHHPTEDLTSDASGQGWGYIATFGAQSYIHDNLGMAILYKKSDLIEVTQDDVNRLVVLKPNHGSLEYYFLAAWQKEPGGIQTKEEFHRYLEESIQRLGSPIQITYN
ncbi:DUF4861 domain-containing protein [Paremcibacter congregatus]|uniref:DUF4861 domain-containing protein n=1 Tax=Paremcibacter congregatus TaxID=2043170 RepID=UPI003A950E7D